MIKTDGFRRSVANNDGLENEKVCVTAEKADTLKTVYAINFNNPLKDKGLKCLTLCNLVDILDLE